MEQNIELLRAVCSCKNKAVQQLVKQAMGQIVALLIQCAVLTSDQQQVCVCVYVCVCVCVFDQQQEIYADTDTLLDEECVLMQPPTSL